MSSPAKKDKAVSQSLPTDFTPGAENLSRLDIVNERDDQQPAVQRSGTQQRPHQRMKGGELVVRDDRVERNEAEMASIRRSLNRIEEVQMKSIQVNDLNQTTEDLLSHIRAVHNEVIGMGDAIIRRVDLAKTDTYMEIWRLQQDAKAAEAWYRKVMGQLASMKVIYQAAKMQNNKIEEGVSICLGNQKVLHDIVEDYVSIKSHCNVRLICESISSPLAELGEKLDEVKASVDDVRGEVDALAFQMQEPRAHDLELLDAMAKIVFLGGRGVVVLAVLLFIVLF